MTARVAVTSAPSPPWTVPTVGTASDPIQSHRQRRPPGGTVNDWPIPGVARRSPCTLLDRRRTTSLPPGQAGRRSVPRPSLLPPAARAGPMLPGLYLARPSDPVAHSSPVCSVAMTHLSLGSPAAPGARRRCRVFGCPEHSSARGPSCAPASSQAVQVLAMRSADVASDRTESIAKGSLAPAYVPSAHRRPRMHWRADDLGGVYPESAMGDAAGGTSRRTSTESRHRIEESDQGTPVCQEAAAARCAAAWTASAVRGAEEPAARAAIDVSSLGCRRP